MANYDVTTAGAQFEFDTQNMLGAVSVQVDVNHFLVFWNGGAATTDSRAQVFAINTSTWAVTTAAAALQFDVDAGRDFTAQTVDTNHFILFWAGPASDGFTQVFTVNTTTWEVTTAAASVEFDGLNGTDNKSARIDTNHFINFWSGSGSDGFVQAFTVNTTTWVITPEGTALEFDTQNCTSNACAIVDANHFLNFFLGGATTTDGFVQVFAVNTSTWAVTTAASALLFDTDVGSSNACAVVDTNHFINFWQGASIDGFVQVFTVNTTTWAVSTAAAQLEFDTQNNSSNAVAKVDTNHFINYWLGGATTTDGLTQVFTVNTTTFEVTTAAASLLFDTDVGSLNSCIQVDTSHFMNLWQGAGADGFAQIFAVSLPAPTSIKTFDGLAYASTKTVNGLAIASVKTWAGLA